MNRNYIEGETFEKKAFKSAAVSEYDQCVFIDCDLSATDLSDSRFIDCEFRSCDLSNSKLIKTSFQNVKFSQCKMMGLLFDQCNTISFEVEFEECQLSHSSFYQMKLQKIRFTGCKLEGVDFTLSDLRSAIITSCDLKDATFSDTLLEKADLRQSVNYSIDPDGNYIKGAIFSTPEVLGLLSKYGIVVK